MQPIVLQPVKVVGWQPATFKLPSRSLGQAPAVAPAPAKTALIDSPIFNFFVYGLGAFATGALAMGAAGKNAPTAATLLGVATGGLGLAALYSLYSLKN